MKPPARDRHPPGQTPSHCTLPAVLLLLALAWPLGTLGQDAGARPGCSDEAALAYGLGMRHFFGGSIPADPATGIALWQRAAEAGHPQAAYQLGRAYHYGFEVDADIPAALHWYSLALAGSVGRAATGMGDIHACVHQETESPEPALAVRFYEEGIRLGDPHSLVGLANLFRTGRGVPQDALRARELLLQASDAGLAGAETILFAMHDRRLLPAELRNEMWNHLFNAARRGHPAAALYVGRILYQGQWEHFQSAEKTVFSRDFEEAARWFEFAAGCGHPRAFVALAEAALAGVGRIPHGPQAAIEYLLRAEALGHAEARQKMLEVAHRHQLSLPQALDLPSTQTRQTRKPLP